MRPKHLLDIGKMPNLHESVKERIHGVSEGKIIWTDSNRVTCQEHGACLCVNKERTLWRCSVCNEGAYVIWDETRDRIVSKSLLKRLFG